MKIIKVSPLFQNHSKHQHPKNKVLHQETFTIPSYQVKKAKILLTVHRILTHTTQRTKERYVKLTKVLFPDSKIPEKLRVRKNKVRLFSSVRFSFVLQGATFILITSSY